MKFLKEIKMKYQMNKLGKKMGIDCNKATPIETLAIMTVFYASSFLTKKVPLFNKNNYTKFDVAIFAICYSYHFCCMGLDDSEHLSNFKTYYLTLTKRAFSYYNIDSKTASNMFKNRFDIYRKLMSQSFVDKNEDNSKELMDLFHSFHQALLRDSEGQYIPLEGPVYINSFFKACQDILIIDKYLKGLSRLLGLPISQVISYPF